MLAATIFVSVHPQQVLVDGGCCSRALVCNDDHLRGTYAFPVDARMHGLTYLLERVIPAQVLQRSTLTTVPTVDGHQPVERKLWRCSSHTRESQNQLHLVKPAELCFENSVHHFLPIIRSVPCSFRTAGT